MSYHILNRGTRREAICRKLGDYDAFVEAVIDAQPQLPFDTGLTPWSGHVTMDRVSDDGSNFQVG